jgi:hypothetical protein
MSAIAGYNTRIQITGTSTAFSGSEPCTTTGSNPTKLSQVTDSTKRVLDPSVAIVVQDNGVTVSASNYTVDYLFGKIQFSTAVTGPVTILSGNYLPLLTVAQARSTSLQWGKSPLNTSIFHDTVTAESYLMGLKASSGSFETIDVPFVDWDGVGGAPVHDPFGIFTAGTHKLLAVRLGGSGGDEFRGWVKFESVDDNADVAGLYTRSVKWIGCAYSATTMDADSAASYSWSYA